MSLASLTPAMISAHEQHATYAERCPICRRFGLPPIDPEQVHPGRVVAVNAPDSANPDEWS